ncbi:MAG: winged helix-turn-helix transcriptional regulator [Thermoplasmata archaeon]|nr:MAG: winged helix-turn-helix transcriptional regulator [Thermoplasmata archaeon]
MYANAYVVMLLDESRFLKCITEETRRNILKFLGTEEKCVCEIVEFLGKEQSVVSHHLALLRGCGLVQSRQDGKKVMYRVSNPGLIGFLKQGELLARIIEGSEMGCG